jgi:amidase
MGRSVADVEALLAVLTGSQVPGVSAAAYGPVGTGSDVVPPVRRYVLGAPAVWLTGDPETDGLFARTLGLIREAGIAVVAIGLPDEDDQVGADEVTVLVHEMSDDLDAYLASRPGAAVASAAEVVAFNTAHPDAELAHYGQEYFEQAVASGGRAAPQYPDARARNIAWAVDQVLAPAFAHGVDALIAPAYGPAWRSDLAGGDSFSGGRVTTAPAIAGWPILTLPIGVVGGLPVGVSLVGPEHGEDHLLEVGAVVEAAVGWSERPAEA